MTYKCRQCESTSVEAGNCQICGIPMNELTMQDGGEDQNVPAPAPATDETVEAPAAAPAPEAPAPAPAPAPNEGAPAMPETDEGTGDSEGGGVSTPPAPGSMPETPTAPAEGSGEEVKPSF